MKRIVSILFALVAIFTISTPKASAAAVRGAYAYDLKLTQSGNGYKFSFKVSTSASKASIILTNKSNGATHTYDYNSSLSPNNIYEFSIDKSSLYAGDYTWEVSVANAASDAVINYHDQGGTPNATLGNRGGVAIDLEPESPFYGYVYTSMAREGGGIQRYNPDLSKIGGMILSDKFNSAATSSPYRIKANSGKLYIADYADEDHSGVYVYNPVNGSFSQMFQGTRASNGQWTNNGVVIGGSMTAVAFYGEGANRKMFAQCEDYYNVSPKWELLRYDLGTSDTWNKAPSKTYPEITKYLSRHNVEIFTCEKGVWLCQNYYSNGSDGNGTHDENTPMFLFMDYDGNIKFNSNSPSFLGTTTGHYAYESGIAISKDLKRLAVAGGGDTNYSNVKIYNITWNGNTPSLTLDREIEIDHDTRGNGAIEQIVFDPADNLLIYSRDKGLMAYTLPNPARNTVTKAPSSQVATGSAAATFNQITEGEGDEKKYSFDLKLNIPYPKETTHAINGYVIATSNNEVYNELKNGDFICIDANGNDITSSVTVQNFPNSDAVLSTENGNRYTIGKPCIALNFTNSSTSILPTIVWKNVNPQLKYDLTLYATSDYECNLITNLSEELTIPLPSLSLPDIGFHKLAGDYSSLATDQNQPLGSHRVIDDYGNHLPSDKILISRANYYGTNGGAITPIRVTDNILGVKDNTGVYTNNDWEINYGLRLYDDNGNQIRYGDFYPQTSDKDYASCYSNEKNIVCDIIGLPVDYKTETAEDGRIRYIYNPTQTEYKTVLLVNFTRQRDKLTFTKIVEETVMTDVSPLPPLGVSASSDEVRGALFIPKNESHYWWNGQLGNNAQEGYYPRYYDALLLFEWNDDSNLNRYMGHYAQTNDVCYGHYENAASSIWTRYAPSSVLTDELVDAYVKNANIEELIDGKIGYDGLNNWSDLAIKNERVPIKVHYVYGDNSDKEIRTYDIRFNVILTAEYPIVATNSEFVFRLDENPETYTITGNNPYITMLSVPTKLPNRYVSSLKINTGVEDIEKNNTPAEYYNLQGVKVDNPSNGIFIKVEGDKATKIFIK